MLEDTVGFRTATHAQAGLRPDVLGFAALGGGSLTVGPQGAGRGDRILIFAGPEGGPHHAHVGGNAVVVQAGDSLQPAVSLIGLSVSAQGIGQVAVVQAGGLLEGTVQALVQGRDIMVAGLFLVAETPVTLCQIELGLGNLGTLRILLQVAAEGGFGLRVIAGEEDFLGRAEVHVLLLGVGAGGLVAEAVDIGEIGVRFLTGPVDGFDGEEGVVGKVAALLGHFLVVGQGLGIVTAVAGDHTQFQKGPGGIGRIVGGRTEGPEGTDGILILPDGDIGAAQFVHRLGIIGRGRGSLLHPLQELDLAREIAEKSRGHAGPVVRIDIIRIRIVGEFALEGGEGGRVVLLEEVAVADARLGIGPEGVVAAFQIVVEPLQGGRIVPFLEVGVGDVVRDEVPFRLAVQRGKVVQVHEDAPGIPVLFVPEVGFGHPVTG